MAVRILFVCHGNICRSPMAEFVMKDMVRARGLDGEIEVSSCATSSEEIGNDVHPGTKAVLDANGIYYSRRAARRMTQQDYAENDYIVAMDRYNLSNMRRFTGDDPDGKVSLLMSHAGPARDVADPWYTGDFSVTYRDVAKGCAGLLDEIVGDRGLRIRKESAAPVSGFCER